MATQAMDSARTESRGIIGSFFRVEVLDMLKSVRVRARGHQVVPHSHFEGQPAYRVGDSTFFSMYMIGGAGRIPGLYEVMPIINGDNLTDLFPGLVESTVVTDVSFNQALDIAETAQEAATAKDDLDRIEATGMLYAKILQAQS